MINNISIPVSTQELCEQFNVTTEIITEIVEHGIVTPEGESPSEWLFTPLSVTITRRATRLYQDLGIDWNGVALIVELLGEREDLKAENEMLKQRLSRFLRD